MEKTIYQHPYNFSRILEQLQMERDDKVPAWEWLAQSYRVPQDFWLQLFRHHCKKIGTDSKSLPFRNYNFYYDLVVRHLSQKRIAFRWYESQGWQQLSYEELHQLSTATSQQWLQQGVEPGQSLCIIAPVNVHLLVSLVTAIRLGMTIAYLPPLGDCFLANRLEALSPDHIAMDYLCARLPKDAVELVLSSANTPLEINNDTFSHVYQSETTFGKFFSPLSETPVVPCELSIDDCYLNAMRDGLFAFVLAPNAHFAAPGVHLLQYQPGLLLSSLLFGATYVEMAIEDFERAPHLLDRFSLAMVGVTCRFRDILHNHRHTAISNWKHWFRNPLESKNWHYWDMFTAKMQLQDIPSSNVVFDSSTGALLFSAQKKNNNNRHLLPLPGTPYQLLETSLSGLPAKDASGVFALLKDKPLPLGLLIVAQEKNELQYLGSIKPKRNGHTYPQQELLDCISHLPFIQQCSMIAVPQGNMQDYQYLLLIFTGADLDNTFDKRRQHWHQQITATIVQHMGLEFIPDRIEFYPLYARITDDDTDHLWCRDQYFMGHLLRKPQLEVYQMLTKLRGIVLEHSSCLAAE